MKFLPIFVEKHKYTNKQYACIVNFIHITTAVFLFYDLNNEKSKSVNDKINRGDLRIGAFFLYKYAIGS